MRLAIVSDIHANLEALLAALRAIADDNVDHLVCLGDIVGYNANPAECIALLRDHRAICVAGNHDRAVAGQLSVRGFSPMAARAVAWTHDKLDAPALAFLAALPAVREIAGTLIAVHGALHAPGAYETAYTASEADRAHGFTALAAHPSGLRVCAFGHTHHAGIYASRAGRSPLAGGDRPTGGDGPAGDSVALHPDAFYLANPGSIGQPRSAERRATYIVLDTTCRTMTMQRVGYDAAAALAKTREAGLLPRGPLPMPAGVRRVARAIRLRRFVAR